MDSDSSFPHNKHQSLCVMAIKSLHMFELPSSQELKYVKYCCYNNGFMKLWNFANDESQRGENDTCQHDLFFFFFFLGCNLK